MEAAVPGKANSKLGTPGSGVWVLPPTAAPTLLWKAAFKADLLCITPREPGDRGLAKWTHLAVADRMSSLGPRCLSRFSAWCMSSLLTCPSVHPASGFSLSLGVPCHPPLVATLASKRCQVICVPPSADVACAAGPW